MNPHLYRPRGLKGIMKGGHGPVFLALFIVALAGSFWLRGEDSGPKPLELTKAPDVLAQGALHKFHGQRAGLVRRWNDLHERIDKHNAKCGAVPKGGKPWDECSGELKELRGAYSKLLEDSRQYNESVKAAVSSWCRLHKVLVPVASTRDVRDAQMWKQYEDKQTAWCHVCDPDNPCPIVARPTPVPAKPVPTSGPHHTGDAPCGNGYVTILGHGTVYYCCPEDHPYLSECEPRQCYTVEDFDTGKIPCDSVLGREIQPGK